MGKTAGSGSGGSRRPPWKTFAHALALPARPITNPKLRQPTLLFVALVAMSAFFYQTWSSQPVPVVSVSIPTPNYVNELYHFSALLPAELDRDYGPPSCQGSVFALKELKYPTLKPLPRMTVCYVRKDDRSGLAFLKGELKPRIEVGRNRQWFNYQEGLPQEQFFGVHGTPGVEQYVVGNNQAKDGYDMRWYEAITQFEGRLYAIELVGPRLEWNDYWPYFKSVLDSLSFETGVLP